MPIGLTPGRLSKGISRQAVKASSDVRSTKYVANLLAQLASTSQTRSEASAKEVHIRLQELASMPHGPAAPKVVRAVLRMKPRFTASNRTECAGSGGSPVISEAGSSGSASGCFSLRTSRIDLPFTQVSRCKGPPLDSGIRSRRAELSLATRLGNTFPSLWLSRPVLESRCFLS